MPVVVKYITNSEMLKRKKNHGIKEIKFISEIDIQFSENV